MKTKAAKTVSGSKTEPHGDDPIAGYGQGQTPEHAAICQALRAAIDTALPKANAKIWHAMPVWFIGEIPVVGYKATPKHVNLLFWNGQAFNEPQLKPAGNFRAAQIQFSDPTAIDPSMLRRWLEKAGREICDYRELVRNRRAEHLAGVRRTGAKRPGGR